MMFPVRLIVIAGPAGSGKSTLANSVAEDLGIPHLDFDTVSHEIIEIRRTENPELSEPELLETFKSERYSELARAIRDCSRDLLIASGPFSQHALSPRLWSDWLGECGEVEAVDFIWLHLDPEIRMGRIIGRNSPRDAQVRSRDQGLGRVPWPVIGHRAVDAGEEIDAQCREVIRTIM